MADDLDPTAVERAARAIRQALDDVGLTDEAAHRAARAALGAPSGGPMTEHLHPAPVEGCYRCDLSADEQTTPLTVEEAATCESQRVYPSGPDHLVPYELALRRHDFVAGATWQAARMPR